jgi:hypothetical protein
MGTSHDNIWLDSFEREMFQTKGVKKIKTHFIFSNFFSENFAAYEITWKDMVEPDWPQMTI